MALMQVALQVRNGPLLLGSGVEIVATKHHRVRHLVSAARPPQPVRPAHRRAAPSRFLYSSQMANPALALPNWVPQSVG
jgi:hypothetical protein